MRKPLYILISLLLFSCGGSDGDEPSPTPTPTPTTQENNAPSVPSLSVPSDGLKCTDNPLDLAWNAAADPDGDTVSYYVQVATNDSFSQDLQAKSIAGTTTSFTLIKGVAYYWRVNAKDSKNKSSNYSSTWKFYSEGEGVSNHLPYAPTLIKPALNTNMMDISTTLEWSSSDVDNDPLKYDVYFGNSNPPTLVSENQSSTTYDVNIDASTTYYWKIEVKDDAGGETVGQVWSFHSE